MKQLRRRLQNPEGRLRKTMEWTSTSFIVVALATAPLEATPRHSTRVAARDQMA